MEVQKLDPRIKRKAAEVVAAAFYNYPMMTYYIPDAEKRKRWLPLYMEKTLNCAMRYGEVLVTSDFSGVMFILPPGHTRITDREYIQNGFLPILLALGRSYYTKSGECEKYVADTHDRLLNGRNHYYLWGLVADPNAQRKGSGSALLSVLTDKADAENMPVYLETHDQNNVAYYGRFGFALIHTGKIPKHGLDIWCMLREAGGQSKQ